MWTDTIAILAPVLFAAVAALVVVRRTFRGATDVREALMTPAVFALAGALVAIAAGMIWIADEHGSVKIDTGIPVAVGGLALGALAGARAQRLYSTMKYGKGVAFVVVVVTLAGSIGATVGWVVGSFEAESAPGPWVTVTQLSLNRMVWGLTIGSSVGLLLGLREVLYRRREV